jgi:hypothetical protein
MQVHGHHDIMQDHDRVREGGINNSATTTIDNIHCGGGHKGPGLD